MNRFGEAERCYRRALAILEKGCRESQNAKRQQAGRTPNASRPSRRSDHAQRLECGELAPAFPRRSADSCGDISGLCALATIHHNLGGLEHERGRYARGEPFARQSVEIRRKALGPNHPEVAADMAALAGLLDGQEKFDEAEELYHAALKIFRRVHGEEHYELAVTFNNLAAIADKKGNAAEAERLYKQSLAIKEKVLGPSHPDVAMTLNNLAMTYAGVGRFAEAEPLFTRALKILEQALGKKHPRTRACRENYRDLQREMKRSGVSAERPKRS
jgi:tetratricopeptide (TPR) repeat protein